MDDEEIVGVEVSYEEAVLLEKTVEPIAEEPIVVEEKPKEKAVEGQEAEPEPIISPRNSPLVNHEVETETPLYYLGNFKRIKRIGTGGICIVDLVEQESTGARFALKTINPNTLEQVSQVNPDAHNFMRRLLREEAAVIEKMRKIDPLHFPSLAIDFTNQEEPGILTEFVPHSLEEKIESGLETKEALNYFVDIASAVCALHREGIVLGDIKPSNFRITDRDNVKFSKGGIVKPVDLNLKYADKEISHQASVINSMTCSMIGTGRVKGTPRYMAPEQWEGKVDERTDVFQLTSLLYELVTGVKPEGKWADISIIKPDLAALDDVVNKGMAQSRENRYGSVKELVDILRAKMSDKVDFGEERQETQEDFKVNGSIKSPEEYWKARAEETNEILMRFYRQNQEVLNGKYFRLWDGTLRFRKEEAATVLEHNLRNDERVLIYLDKNGVAVNFLNKKSVPYFKRHEESVLLGKATVEEGYSTYQWLPVFKSLQFKFPKVPKYPILSTKGSRERYKVRRKKYEEDYAKHFQDVAYFRRMDNLAALYAHLVDNAAIDTRYMEGLKKIDQTLRSLPGEITQKLKSSEFAETKS